jgi:hypothetical protein
MHQWRNDFPPGFHDEAYRSAEEAWGGVSVCFVDTRGKENFRSDSVDNLLSQESALDYCQLGIDFVFSALRERYRGPVNGGIEGKALAAQPDENPCFRLIDFGGEVGVYEHTQKNSPEEDQQFFFPEKQDIEYISK